MIACAKFCIITFSVNCWNNIKIILCFVFIFEFPEKIWLKIQLFSSRNQYICFFKVEMKSTILSSVRCLVVLMRLEL